MTLYQTDFVAWTQQQTTLLRSMPRTHSIDMEHLIDEIEGLGRSAIADLSTAIRGVMEGLIHSSINHASITLEDIYSAQSEAIIRADAGVWRHVELDRVWRLAKRSVDIDLPEICPLTIELLIAADFDVSTAITALRL